MISSFRRRERSDVTVQAVTGAEGRSEGGDFPCDDASHAAVTYSTMFHPWPPGLRLAGPSLNRVWGHSKAARVTLGSRASSTSRGPGGPAARDVREPPRDASSCRLPDCGESRDQLGPHRGLELDGRQVRERRVQPVMIVDLLDERADGAACFVRIAVRSPEGCTSPRSTGVFTESPNIVVAVANYSP